VSTTWFRAAAAYYDLETENHYDCIIFWTYSYLRPSVTLYFMNTAGPRYTTLNPKTICNPSAIIAASIAQGDYSVFFFVFSINFPTVRWTAGRSNADTYKLYNLHYNEFGPKLTRLTYYIITIRIDISFDTNTVNARDTYYVHLYYAYRKASIRLRIVTTKTKLHLFVVLLILSSDGCRILYSVCPARHLYIYIYIYI